MLELIFVIVIMAILAKFGVELYLQIVNNYVNTIDTTEKEEQTQVLIEQIANRLRERIPESTRLTAGGIDWIGVETSGWNGGLWSGIADIGRGETDSNATLIESPGTSASRFNGTNGKYALFFKQNDVMARSLFYNNAGGVMHAVSTFDTSAGRNAFVLSANAGKISEHYFVSEFAYSLDWDSAAQKLYLYTFKPWINNVKTRYLLGERVSLFTVKNLKGNAGGMLITVCMRRHNFTGEGDASICKQKFIF